MSFNHRIDIIDNQLYFISQSGGISEYIISVIIRFVIVKII